MAIVSNESINDIINLLKQKSTEGINISPYLSAIQNLNGQTPGEKYKELNRIVNNIVKSNDPINNDFSHIDVSVYVEAALKPLVQIRIGNTLKSNEAVIEALKSEDIPVINQAFKAKWFFSRKNPIVTVDYFVANIFPYVSEIVRFRIIKSLSVGLVGNEKKAEEFFNIIAKLYVAQESVPLLPACSEIFIDEAIVKYELFLSYKILVELYKKYPNLVIRCLKIFAKSQSYKKEKKSPITISRKIFDKFLPHLIRHHVYEYIELRGPPEKYEKKLGSTNAKLFLKNGLNILIEKPRLIFDILPLRLISKKLTLQQFEIMCENLIPYKVSDFKFEKMISLLQYYPKEKRENLIKNLFKSKYSIDLTDINSDKISFKKDRYSEDLIPFKHIHDKISANLFDKLFIKYADIIDYKNLFDSINYTKEKRNDLINKVYQRVFGSSTLAIFDDDKRTPHYESHYTYPDYKKIALKYLQPTERKRIVLNFIPYYIYNNSLIRGSSHYKWHVYMQPKESFPIFIEAIATSSNEIDRRSLLIQMTDSAAIDNNKDDLLAFLQYYNNKHKNENFLILSGVIKNIDEKWDLKCFDKSHFSEVYQMLQGVLVKNESKYLYSFNISRILHSMVDYFVKEQMKNNEFFNENNILLDKILHFIVDWNISMKFSRLSHSLFETYEEDSLSCSEIVNLTNIRKYCFDKALKFLALKNNVNDVKWQFKSVYKKHKIIKDIIHQIECFNYFVPNKYITEIYLSDYPIFIQLLKEVLSYNHDFRKRRDLWNKAKSIEPNLETLLEINLKNDKSFEYALDIKISKGLIDIKKNWIDISENLDKYLNKCKKDLHMRKKPYLKFLYRKRKGKAAKRFLLSLKWYNDAPVKIIQNCLQNVESISSFKVLGLMLEGEVLNKLVLPLVPKDSSVNIDSDDVNTYYAIVKSSVAAMKYPSPPVPIETMLMFFKGEYGKLVAPTATHTLKRVSKDKIERLAEQLVDKPVSVKRHGIRLCLEVTSKHDQEDLIKKLWRKESHPSIREIIATEIRERFAQSPDDSNWRLMEICIEGLTAKDEVPVKNFCNVPSIKSQYINQYITKLIEKIKELAATWGDLKFSEITAIKNVLENFPEVAVPFLTEDVITSIVEEFCFMELSKLNRSLVEAAEKFAEKVFERPYSANYYKFSFNQN